MPVERVLAEIPERLVGLVASQSAERVGMVIRDTTTKQILGHLQETGLTQNLVSKALSNAPGGIAVLSNPVSAITSVAAVYQNHNMSKQLDLLQSMMGGLQALQVATLVTSVAGIGVTAVSTAVILNRLKGIEDKLSAIDGKLDRAQIASENEAIRKTLTRIETYLSRLQEAEETSDHERLIRTTEEELHTGFDELRRQCETVVKRPSFEVDFAIGTISALALCSSAQIKSLVCLGEYDRAMRRSEAQSRHLNQLSMLVPRDILVRNLGGDGQGAALIDAAIGEIRLRSATMPSFVASLDAQGIEGRAYFQRASEETEQALLLLPARA